MIRSLDDLVRLRDGGLRNLWMRGSVPSADELVGGVFRGWNTALAAARSPVGGRAFAKGFFRESGAVQGCNFPVTVHGTEWRVNTDRPFGFFRVGPTEGSAWAGRRALLLDYGRGQERVSAGVRRRVVSRFAPVLRDLV